MNAARPVALALVAWAAASLSACRPSFSDAEAEDLVRRYTTLVSQAYRAGDFSIVLPVVGPDEARRVTAHIGVKLDQGVTLDAILTRIEFKGVERKGEEVVVATEEAWSYTTRRMGTGQPAGPESKDRYRMRYHLRKLDGKWVVVDTEFAEKPEIGTPQAPPKLDAKDFHGFTAPPAAEGTPSGPQPPAGPPGSTGPMPASAPQPAPRAPVPPQPPTGGGR